MSMNEDEDSDDELFMISKRQSKKKSNKRNSTSRCQVKKDNDDNNYFNTPESQKESSSFVLQDSSGDEKQNQKMQSNTSVKSKRMKQKKQQNKAEQQQQQQQYQEEQQPIKFDEEYYQLAQQTLPKFMQSEYIRDSKGKRPNDPDYNPSTIYIPQDEYQRLPPMFKQYWNAKQNHFDFIVFIRCGRWISVIYNDAITVAKMFNRYLGFWGKDRACVTVYDNQLPIYQRALLEKGYKMIMIEQLENADTASKEDGGVVKREITQMISRGTLQDLGDSESYEQRNLLVLVYSNAPINLKGYSYIYGVSIVDCTTNNFSFDQFFDDAQSNHLRSIIYNTKPVEVILCRTPPEIEKIIKNICNPTVVISKKSFRDCQFIFQQLKIEYMELSKVENNQNSKLFDGIVVPTKKHQSEQKMEIDINQGINSNKRQEIREEQCVENYQLSQDYPNILIELEKQYYHEKEQLDNEDEESNYYSYYHSIQSFYLLLCYLRQLLISNQVYRRGRFNFIDSNFNHNSQLCLDSYALESLEIFRVNLQTKITNSGSLFKYLNRCTTHCGQRLLTKWIQSPLQNYKSIIERQQCVKELSNIIPKCYEFQKRIKSPIDLERAITKCFNTIHSHKLKAVPSAKCESIGKIKLKEIKIVLNNIRQAVDAFKIFDQDIEQFKSQKLQEILNQKQNTLILKKQLDELEKSLIMDDNQLKPVQGISPEYDQTLRKLTDINVSLQDELKKWKEILKCPDIIYTHSKIPYQLEIPQQYLEGCDQIPKELIITSKVVGYQRFQTTFIEEQLRQQKLVEDELSKKLIPFINQYFTKFYSCRKEFFQLISNISEADCLISLALVSKEQKKVSCFPNINKDTEKRDFKLIEAYHPCLLQQRDIEWVPNTVKFNDSIDSLLITGPNMSGKSTFLRLIGVSIILAQIGSAVPAQSFSLTPFDRIFCRLGATDRLLEGKSTFFIELEETQTILDQSTSRSLAIIDELGRGTSTYDGVALASAVLRYLSEKVKPLTLFATHYHILLDEFALFKNIKQCVMQHYQEKDQVVFTYKLTEGIALKSFATNVAQIARVPEEVIEKARQMETKITKEEYKINKNREILKQFNQIITQLL